MKIKNLKLGTTAVLAALMISTAHADQNYYGQKFFTNENVGRIVGTGVGALLGSQIGKGTGNDMAIAAGAVGGYIFGGKVGRNWNSGRQYTSNSPTKGYLYPVQATPELEHIDSVYSATRTSNVRGGPGTKYVVVGGLQPGEQVHVLGRVVEKNWYMVAQDDIVKGFVHMSLLQPANEYYSYNSN
ncbi:MAG: SH3 domain-containing protein [Arenicellales bacterium]